MRFVAPRKSGFDRLAHRAFTHFARDVQRLRSAQGDWGFGGTFPAAQYVSVYAHLRRPRRRTTSRLFHAHS